MSNNPGILASAQQGQPQQLQNAYNNYLSHTQAQQQALQAFNQLAQQQKKNWVINGQAMTQEEFANTLWPDVCAEKTFFYLKYKEEEQ